MSRIESGSPPMVQGAKSSRPDSSADSNSSASASESGRAVSAVSSDESQYFGSGPESATSALGLLSQNSTSLDTLSRGNTIFETLADSDGPSRTSVPNSENQAESQISFGMFGAAGTATVMPRFSNVVDGTHGTEANTALKILDSMSNGGPAFRPDLGERGLVQWFVTEGSPRTGSTTPSAVHIPAEVIVPRGSDVLEFNDTKLREIYDELLPGATDLAKEQYATNFPARSLTSNRSVNRIEYNARNIAEGQMWTELGKRVAASDSGLGRVVQSGASIFSRDRPGTFMLTSKPELATVPGGVGTLLDIIRTNGIQAEPALLEAAEKASQSGAIKGTISDVLRVGGRVLVVAGAAADVSKIYMADDRIGELVTVGGGWAGAMLGVTLYNSATASSNLAGPWAWAANGVGNVLSGVAGYYGGESIAEVVYDLAIDPNFIQLPAE